jgi:ribonuclease HI
MNTKVLIYTDGASRGNPGTGGWGAIVLKGHNVIEVGGRDNKTTNNRMELSATIGALEQTETSDKIRLYTDSEYLINGITKWVFGWLKNDWKTQAKADVLNKDLWQKLYSLTEDREIEWKKVRGHAGHPANERVDEIATTFADENPTKLFSGDIKEYGTNLSEPTDAQISGSEKRKNAKAHSYLSLVDGQLQKHSNWDDCKARVDGVAGAKFRKSISAEDEQDIIKNWGLS